MRSLLIATQNRGKLAEFRRILALGPVDLLCLPDLEIGDEIEETGETFAQNAALKAGGYARLAAMPTLADDSGLIIDALDGRPGIHSARYAGETAGDADRIKKVLSEMEHVEQGSRTARFVCALSLADPDGVIQVVTEGICEGSIVNAARGANGFGYDPIFLPDGFDQTYAELDERIKDRISHRGSAIAKIIPFLRGFFNI
jgi:XTP/dITP diphosphohydrolase